MTAAKKGDSWHPVCGEGRRIATTHWGRAWCDHIEGFHDFSNRLPRGRTYVRNGSVVDLRIAEGVILARVAGSSLYRQEVKITPCRPALWQAIVARCSGRIASLVELLAGRISDSVMEEMSKDTDGLFPDLREVSLECSCPDWASLCKHLAAVLYGVGVRLDEDPALLFTLRGVDPGDLIGTGPTSHAAAADVATVTGDLGSVFGIDLSEDPVEPRGSEAKGTRSRATKAKRAPSASTKGAAKRAATAPKSTAPKSKAAKAKKTKTRSKPRAPRRAPSATITRRAMIELGVPAGTISTWLAQGVLEPTDERGVYRQTRESRQRLAPYAR